MPAGRHDAMARARSLARVLGLAVSVVTGAGTVMAQPASTPASVLPAAADTAPTAPRFEPVGFNELPGWERDDQAAAFAAFLRSCRQLDARAASALAEMPEAQRALLEPCRQALMRAGRKVGRVEARRFFQHFFVPHRVVHAGPAGLLTGYYEPLLQASRRPTERFRVPLYKRPPDLENVVDETQRAAAGQGFSHMRRTAAGLEPYFTRAEIEAGALAGRGLEFLWVADPVDAFFLQIQGSGRVRLTDGSTARVAYDGKNGHPYSSVGRYLIDQGVIGAESMTLDKLGAYLKADAARGRAIMQRNASFVFFRELPAGEAKAPLGAMGIELTTGRSLAVDTAVQALGTPIFVSSPTLTHAARGRPFQRLMIAQDVGSAIRGPERGDIYFGSGAHAGSLAGITKHAGRFYVLLPKAAAVSVTGR